MSVDKKLYSDVLERLSKLSIDYLKFDHDATPNMESMGEILKEQAEKHNTDFAKNLLIKSKGGEGLFFVLAHHETDTKMKNLGQVFGVNANKLRLADEDVLTESLSVKRGSLTPLSLLFEKTGDIRVYFDESLKDKKVFVHPLINTESFSIHIDDLVKFVESCGKKIHWFSVDQLEKLAAKPEEPKDSESLLGITADKTASFADWYSQVIVKSEMIEYYDVSGCYILRPWSYFIWETIQRAFDERIKKHEVQNAYFPMFVTQKKLETEKDHVEGFSPEVAWVTRSGKSELAEPIAIRPTSETIMYPYFAKWIRSHRDLPLKLNQWTSVVRWEFKHPTPFIRTREFLWQEGHTAHSTRKEALEMVDTILDDYVFIYHDLLATPVVKGTKSEAEKFPGGDITKSIEGFIPEIGRAVQAATSHLLGQNFSRMFGIEFEDEKGNKEYAHQTSWGLTTRAIGVMIMTHGDNKGLVLPPKIAPVQVIIIPIIFKTVITEEQRNVCIEIESILKKAGIRAQIDDRSNYTPGWKYNHWEVKGVCLRFEVGPRDIENKSVRVVVRDNMEKMDIPIAQLETQIPKILDEFQARLLEKAMQKQKESIVNVDTFEKVMDALNQRKMIIAPWCEDVPCEEEIKKETTRLSLENEDCQNMTGAMKSLCIPKDQPHQLEEGKTKCFFCDKPAKRFTLFGRSY
ncbi:proline-tRNA synthetase [Cryptosporidium canis]|uniref:proline--tRNA ligase n=1 Tax=Cryptosporidium canis TaxID=195482 RepID=A0ABQ8P3K0_9CRYT|nr:proline-tRNA synthetase [Cryptosporidium canis]KAJ1606888.1 proline-tRNA synthetase [Cryptosporidium canis]